MVLETGLVNLRYAHECHVCCDLDTPNYKTDLFKSESFLTHRLFIQHEEEATQK